MSPVVAVRSVVVGAGLMGRWHALELARAGGQVVGVADVDRAAAERLAAQLPAPRASDDLDRLLAETRPDVVHVCTPMASHVEIAERALNAGAHVLVEKPVAATTAETARLIELAESRALAVCPVHQYVFQAPLLARGALDRLAPVLDLSWLACSAGAAGASHARADEVVADILPHPLSVFGRLLGEDLSVIDWHVSRPRPGELRASAETAGASLSIAISMGGRPTCNELRVIGGGGTLHVDLFHGYAIREPGAASRRRKIVRPFALAGASATAAATNLARRAIRREPAYPGLRTLIAGLYAFVRGAGPAPITHEECLAVARARERLLT